MAELHCMDLTPVSRAKFPRLQLLLFSFFIFITSVIVVVVIVIITVLTIIITVIMAAAAYLMYSPGLQLKVLRAYSMSSSFSAK